MRSLIVLFWVIALLLMPAPRPCSAAMCSCGGHSTAASELADSAAVFLGRVKRIEIVEVPNPGGSGSPIAQQVVYLEVSRSWKGAATRDLVVRTGYGGGDCGYGFVQGDEYLVYARSGLATTPEVNMLFTSVCSRTTPASSASDDLRQLGAGTAPSLATSTVQPTQAATPALAQRPPASTGATEPANDAGTLLLPAFAVVIAVGLLAFVGLRNRRS